MSTNTGEKWGSLAFAQKVSAGGDWDNVAINDDAGQGSDPLALDQKESFQLCVQLVEDNTGAINGVVTLAILGDTDGSNWEDPPGLANAQVGSPWKIQITPVQNDTVYWSRVFRAKWFGPNPKIYILNECGQQLVTDVRYRTTDIPAAVA